MADLLVTAFDLRLPLIAAPMAGGPGTSELVIAAGRAGALGFLAAGYKSADAMSAEVATVASSGVPFGVNLFAPNPQPVDVGEYEQYAADLRPEAERFGVDLTVIGPREDDDDWLAKVDALIRHPVPVVSFTFGIPEQEVLAALRATGALLVQTVTTVEEAILAAGAGVDALAVQGWAAGGHSGTLTPRLAPRERPLAELVFETARAVSLPIIAAGGVSTATDVAAVMAAGAQAVAVGTILLRADEAGTNPTHRGALADPSRTETILTHAFTGRPARGLRNDFIDTYDERAPYGYPALHHLTSPIRKVAAAAGDADRLHLWAGTGYRRASDEPVATILRRLADRG